jgi:DNA-binding response OmpR family regulator
MSEQTILVVDDEEAIAEAVRARLESEGYQVVVAYDGPQAIKLHAEHRPDLVVLDLMLPGMDGLEVCQVIQRNSWTPVLMLTARTEEADKVTGFAVGADDYLTKPFSMRELSARIRASVRHGRIASTVLTVGDLVLDTRTRVATRGDRSADLPSREFALLEYLMRHAGHVATRQQLLDAVWGFDFDTGSNVVDVYVGYLRRKLDSAGSPSVIETVRGAGYRVPG